MQKDFEKITGDILNNNNFKELDKEIHHGITRYGHSVRVAKGVYAVTKTLKFKTCEEATRAALLHDFYFNYQLEDIKERNKLSLHPKFSKENALKYYDLSDKQINMIESHMFPLGDVKPKCKESICLTIVDKVVALYEMQRYKLSMKFSIYVLFILNMLIIQE